MNYGNGDLKFPRLDIKQTKALENFSKASAKVLHQVGPYLLVNQCALGGLPIFLFFVRLASSHRFLYP